MSINLILACEENSIKCSEDFSLAATLGEPVQIRQWQIAGLPKDQVSIQCNLTVKITLLSKLDRLIMRIVKHKF